MTNCTYCNQPALEGQKLNCVGNHAACSAECDNRMDNGLCVACGKNKRISPSAICMNCKNNESGFSGYPGA